MQKKIIALAIAAAFSAPAFADTTVYGIVDAALANISSNATGAKSHMTVLSGGLSTSRFGVKVVEDLDNGMKAVGVLEYALDVANNETVGTSAGAMKARQQMVAVAGGMGTVAAGYLQTAGYDFTVKFDPAAGSQVDALAKVNPTALINTSSRAPHALAYISPDMGGVTVAFNHSFDAGNQGNSLDGKITANLLSATYAAGPLAVGGVYVATAVEGSVGGAGEVTELGLGASYDLGVAKLMGTYMTTESGVSGSETDSAMSFSAVAPVGPGALVASVAKNSIKSTVGDDNDTSITVAYLQGLSKTTTAYAALNRTTTQGSPDDVTVTVLAVGLKKAF
ncbi:MAG: porin [Sideroxyarcus sp.]|nr:porin [Sideroxyarcus sp.]